MMSKINFSKQVHVKILIGFLTFACFIAVTACDLKKLTRSTEKVYEEVEQMPEYPGGNLELRKYISNTLRYPVLAQSNGTQGKVLVSFVIGKDGSVKNTEIERGVDTSLDAEALRVVNSLPKWKPGKEKGKKVAVHFTMPINFILQ